MGRYTAINGQPLTVFLDSDVLDGGWSVHSGYAQHSSCNQGYIRNLSFTPEVGKSYRVTYQVFERTSGSVHINFGGVTGQYISQNGTFTEDFGAVGGGILFWSDGDLKITGLSIAEITQEEGEKGYTLSFNTRNLQWVGYRSYVPEFATKFVDSYFGFKDGGLWKHNVSELRNNFYGEQHKSVIEFYVNINPTQIKNFYSMRVKSNKAWSVPEVNVFPRAGKSDGQRSRIKKGNFENYQGDWFADFLKDLNDPRFGNENDALFKGADLQGGVAKIRIENDDTVEVRLLSVDIEVAEQNYTY